MIVVSSDEELDCRFALVLSENNDNIGKHKKKLSWQVNGAALKHNYN